MYNPESALENETHTLLWDFEKQTNLLISTRRSDLVIINKKKKRKRKGTCRIVDFIVPADHRVKLKESERKDKYQGLAKELKKKQTMEHDSDTNCKWCSWYSHLRICIKNGSKRMSGDHPNYSTIEIGQILRRVLETWGDLLSLKLQWETIG